MLLEVEKTALDDSWQELIQLAASAKELTSKRIGEALAAREKYDAEQAELEELRKKQAEQERQRIEQEQRLKQEADEARAADVEHRDTINNSILAGLIGLGIEEAKAIKLIKHIASNKIAHLTINY